MRTHPPMSTKTLSVGIPCYNSAEYMDHAISSILEGAHFSDDIQVIVVDDGSTKDDTFAKAKAWEARYPDLVKAVHQENGGHGMAVLSALEAADDVPWESEEVPSDLTDAAGDELGGLRDRGFSLVHGGYLDLLGNVWGCVAQGADEVVVCVVSETAGGTSVVSRLTLGVDRWEELCG